MELDGILNYPVEEDGEYVAFIKYLETKKSEKAKKTFEKVKVVKNKHGICVPKRLFTL